MLRHSGFGHVDLVGHSYVGTMIALCAAKFPAYVRRAVLIGPTPPTPAKQYPEELMNADGVLAEVFARLGELQAQRHAMPPQEFCEQTWSILARIYVADARDAHRIDWGRCDLANERNFMQHWMVNILPSLQRLALTAPDLTRITMPFLLIHGRKDRSAPYGGSLDWARLLPNARLITIDHAAHAPWIEAPQLVFDSIDAFLDGAWPAAATRIGETL
jgi:pimeloyl-ACP methyl ester carboxylesterase